jgi:hypothetical protein
MDLPASPWETTGQHRRCHHYCLPAAHFLSINNHGKWVIVMWCRLISWWQPPKFCMLMWTSGNSLIMYAAVYVEIISLFITTWNRQANNSVIFHYKELKKLFHSQVKYFCFVPIFKSSMIPPSTMFTASHLGLDLFVFASGFIHDYRLLSITCENISLLVLRFHQQKSSLIFRHANS